MVQYWQYHMGSSKTWAAKLKHLVVLNTIQLPAFGLAGHVSKRGLQPARQPSGKTVSLGPLKATNGTHPAFASSWQQVESVNASAAIALARHKRTLLPQGLVDHGDKSALQNPLSVCTGPFLQ